MNHTPSAAPSMAPAPLERWLTGPRFAALPAPANVLVVRTDRAGDFSTYTLRLVNDASAAAQDS